MKKTSKKEKYDVVRNELNIEFSQWYDYYDYNDYDWYSDECNNFSYIKKDFYYDEIVSGPIFRRRKWQNQYFPYHIVDMNSFYSTQERRNKLIDELLGYSNTKVVYKPTFADIWK
jgi:hypothetical protein